MNDNMTHTAKKTFRVMVVGCGAIGSLHAACLHEMPSVEIVAFCDIQTERAENLRQKYAPSAAIGDDYERMLVALTPDAVHICTPHYLHCAMTVSAMKAGVAVFLEKPIAISNGEIATMLAAEKTYGGRVCVSFQNRFLPRTQAAYRLCQSHGGVKGAFCHVVWSRDEKYYSESGWRGKWATEGGSAMINQAIHTLDLCIAFLGTPKSISATVANHHLKGSIETEDSCEAYITFDSGATALFYTTTAHVRSMPVFLEFVCADGAIVQISNDRVYENDREVAVSKIISAALGKADWGNGHQMAIRAFYTAEEKGDKMPITLASAAVSVEVLLAAYRSGGREIMLTESIGREMPTIPDTSYLD